PTNAPGPTPGPGVLAHADSDEAGSRCGAQRLTGELDATRRRPDLAPVGLAGQSTQTPEHRVGGLRDAAGEPAVDRLTVEADPADRVQGPRDDGVESAALAGCHGEQQGQTGLDLARFGGLQRYPR